MTALIMEWCGEWSQRTIEIFWITAGSDVEVLLEKIKNPVKNDNLLLLKKLTYFL